MNPNIILQKEAVEKNATVIERCYRNAQVKMAEITNEYAFHTISSCVDFIEDQMVADSCAQQVRREFTDKATKIEETARNCTINYMS